MLNQIVLIGRLVKDIELKALPNGKEVTSFTLAVQRNFKNQQGEKETDFINCVCFRKTAEVVGQYVKKGNRIAVEGRIQTRSYDAQDGTKRYVTEVICDNVVFLESKSQNENNSYYQQTSTTKYEFNEDDLPF